jgi:DNA-binding NarL/FixJ family response regulator
MLVHKVLLHSLTDTQVMILYLATHGLPINNIAERLELAENEVRKEFRRALRKLKPSLRNLFCHFMS